MLSSSCHSKSESEKFSRVQCFRNLNKHASTFYTETYIESGKHWEKKQLRTWANIARILFSFWLLMKPMTNAAISIRGDASMNETWKNKCPCQAWKVKSENKELKTMLPWYPWCYPTSLWMTSSLIDVLSSTVYFFLCARRQRWLESCRVQRPRILGQNSPSSMEKQWKGHWQKRFIRHQLTKRGRTRLSHIVEKSEQPRKRKAIPLPSGQAGSIAGFYNPHTCWFLPMWACHPS